MTCYNWFLSSFDTSPGAIGRQTGSECFLFRLLIIWLEFFKKFLIPLFCSYSTPVAFNWQEELATSDKTVVLFQLCVSSSDKRKLLNVSIPWGKLRSLSLASINDVVDIVIIEQKCDTFSIYQSVIVNVHTEIIIPEWS